MTHTPARVKDLICYASVAIGLFVQLAVSPVQAEESIPELRGQLLIAADSISDPRFQRTVIYIADHDTMGGALGLVVNQPLGDMPLDKLLNSIGAEAEATSDPIPAYYGGPVEPSRVFLLLPPPAITEAEPTPAPAVIKSLDNVISIINDENRPTQSMFVLGYSGWSPGQLETELAAGDWHIIPFDETLVFGGEFEQMWDRAVQRRAIDL